MRHNMQQVSRHVLTVALTGRGVTAGLMLILAGGRFGLWQAKALADLLPNQVYAWLLASVGAVLLVTLPVHYHRAGRLVSALGACLLAGMAWDVGYLGNTALIEGWLAVSLAVSALGAPEC